jgi:hypothetical protein
MRALLRGLVAFLIISTSPMLLHAATRRVELWEGDLTLFDQLTGAVIAKPQSVYGRMLVANGVDPASDKGRLILAWVIRISRDVSIADSVHRMGNAYLNRGLRTKLMADGLNQLPPPLMARSARSRVVHVKDAAVRNPVPLPENRRSV